GHGVDRPASPRRGDAPGRTDRAREHGVAAHGRAAARGQPDSDRRNRRRGPGPEGQVRRHAVALPAHGPEGPPAAAVAGVRAGRTSEPGRQPATAAETGREPVTPPLPKRVRETDRGPAAAGPAPERGQEPSRQTAAESGREPGTGAAPEREKNRQPAAGPGTG